MAEEKAKKEAEEKAKKEAEEKAKREAEEKAKREAEEKAKRIYYEKLAHSKFYGDYGSSIFDFETDNYCVDNDHDGICDSKGSDETTCALDLDCDGELDCEDKDCDAECDSPSL